MTASTSKHATFSYHTFFGTKKEKTSRKIFTKTFPNSQKNQLHETRQCWHFWAGSGASASKGFLTSHKCKEEPAPAPTCWVKTTWRRFLRCLIPDPLLLSHAPQWWRPMWAATTCSRWPVMSCLQCMKRRMPPLVLPFSSFSLATSHAKQYKQRVAYCPTAHAKREEDLMPTQNQKLKEQVDQFMDMFSIKPGLTHLVPPIIKT